MILPFVGCISLTPPVGTPLQLERWRGALQTGIWTGNIYFLNSFSLEKRVSCRDFVTFLQTPKAPFEIPDLRLVTFPYMLEFFEAIINLIYHQFVCAAAMSFANVITIPACATGGQQGVIGASG